MANKNTKTAYKINELSQNFIRLMFEKGYIVSNIVNGKFQKPYTKKQIKNADKLISVILLKKPREAIIYFVENNSDLPYANPWINHLKLIVNDNNEAVIYTRQGSVKFEELYREAKFLTDIQFWK